MDTQDITTAVMGDRLARRFYCGTFSLDRFKQEFSSGKNGLYIFNTDPSWKPGQHWLSVYRDSHVCEFFDSYGFSVSYYSLDEFFSSLNVSIVSPHKRLQGELSTVCGDYAVLYCLLRYRGWNVSDFVNRFLSVDDAHLRDHLIRYIILNKIFLSDSIDVESIHLQVATPFCAYDDK